MSGVTIRPERIGDEDTIHRLVEAAFRDHAFSRHDEQHLVDALRRDGDLALSLVAEDDGRIVGHIAFSPVTIGDGTPGWHGLGPVSVWPELHGKGIGSRIIHRGIAEVRERGAAGIVLLGNPRFYRRFGFRHDARLSFAGAPAGFFQCLVLAGNLPEGEVAYAPAFRTL